MEGYSVKIINSSRQLSAKERIAVKDLTESKGIDEIVTEECALIINPVAFVVLEVHNEKSDNVDYYKYVLEDKDGQRYDTGSEPLFTSFMDIYEEMKGEDEEWGIKISKQPSKNYKGKFFLTCTIV